MKQFELKDILGEMVSNSDRRDITRLDRLMNFNRKLDATKMDITVDEIETEDLKLLMGYLLSVKAKSDSIIYNAEEQSKLLKSEDLFFKVYDGRQGIIESANYLFIECIIRDGRLSLNAYQDMYNIGNRISHYQVCKIEEEITEEMVVDLYPIYRLREHGKEPAREIKEFLENHNIKVEGVY